MTITVTEWTAASNHLFKSNLSSTTATNATSLGTGNNGPNGTDIAYPIQLSSSRWLWLFGDTWWPSAAGQSRLASPFVGNVVMHQIGADPSTAAAVWYCGSRPGMAATGTAPSNTEPWPYFNSWEYAPRFQAWDAELGLPGAFKYPMCGIKLRSDCVLVLGMLHMSNTWTTDDPNDYAQNGFQGVGAAADTFPVGPWAELLWGASGASVETTTPDTWVHQEVETDLPRSWAGYGQRQGFTFQYGCDLVGDHLVVWCQGPWDGTGHVSVCRYPLTEVLQGIMRAPEWWAGGERWVPDRPNAQRRIRVSNGRMTCEQGGAVFKRPDGRYQMLTVPDRFFDPFEPGGTPPSGNRQQGITHLAYSIASEPGAVFDKLNDFYEIPVVVDDYDFRYSAYCGQGMTWAGKASVNDQLIVYSTHNTKPSPDSNPFNAPVFNNTLTYQPKIVQAVNL